MVQAARIVNEIDYHRSKVVDQIGIRSIKITGQVG